MDVSTVAERVAGDAPSDAAGRPARSRLARLLVLTAAFLGLWLLLATTADRARADQDDQDDQLATALEQYGDQLSPASVQALLDRLPPPSGGGSAEPAGVPGPPVDPPTRGPSDESGSSPVVDPPAVVGQPPAGPPAVEAPHPAVEAPLVEAPPVDPTPVVETPTLIETPPVVETPPVDPAAVDPAAVDPAAVDPAAVIEPAPVVEAPPVVETPPVDPAAVVVEVAEVAAVPDVPAPAVVPDGLADCVMLPLPGPASVASRATVTQHPAEETVAAADPEPTTSPSRGGTPLPPAPPLAPTSLPVPPAPPVPGGTTATASAGPSTCGAGHSDRHDLLTAVLAAGLPASLARATVGYAGGPAGSVVRGVGEPGDRPD